MLQTLRGAGVGLATCLAALATAPPVPAAGAAGGSAAPAHEIAGGDAIVAARGAAAPALAQARALLQSGSWDALAQQLAHWRAAAPLEPLRYEFLLHALVVDLRAAPAAADNRALRGELDALTRQPGLALQRLEDHGRSVPATLYALDAAARGTLRNWQLQADTAAARKALERGEPAALAGTDPAAQAAAVAGAPQAQLELLRRSGALLAPEALRVAARRLADAGLYRQLLAGRTDETVLQALPELAAALDAHTAATLLMQAAARDELASAAILALGRLPPGPAIEAFLLDGLGSTRTGSSCAAALGRSLTPALRAELVARSERAADGAGLRNALLALQIDGSAESRAALAAFTRRGAMPAELRQEVASWLR